MFRLDSLEARWCEHRKILPRPGLRSRVSCAEFTLFLHCIPPWRSSLHNQNRDRKWWFQCRKECRLGKRFLPKPVGKIALSESDKFPAVELFTLDGKKSFTSRSKSSVIHILSLFLHSIFLCYTLSNCTRVHFHSFTPLSVQFYVIVPSSRPVVDIDLWAISSLKLLYNCSFFLGSGEKSFVNIPRASLAALRFASSSNSEWSNRRRRKVSIESSLSSFQSIEC